MNLNRVMDGLTRSGIGGGLDSPQTFELLGYRADGKPAWRKAAPGDTEGVSDKIGLLAWRCFRVYCARADGARPARKWLKLKREQFIPQDPYTREFLDFVLLRAMITAAGSDGHIDENQRMRILERICILDMPTSEKMFLMEEIQRPLSRSALTGYGKSPDLAILVYTASAVAIDHSQLGSHHYLAELADNLELPYALAAAITIGVTSPDASFAPGRRQRFVQDQVIAA